MSAAVLTHVANKVATLTLNRPEAMNAMLPEHLALFISELRAVEARKDVRVIVVTGAGRSFCSGGDLNFLQTVRKMSEAEVKEVVYEGFAGASRALRLCNKPTIAAVNGPAVGAGCEFAISCDLRVVKRKAFFSEAWIELGTVPALGGMFILPRLIGLGRATNMILRGTRVYGEEARAIGLAEEVTDEENFQEVVDAMAADLARRPPQTMAVAKQGLRRGQESSYAAEMEFNVYAQAMLIKGEAHREGVLALLEKRPAVFD
jgi:enoyl-CoA hydratase/carnithine racemase